MTTLKTIKNIAAASALILSAGMVHAQAVSVSGTMQTGSCSSGAVTGSINIDQDVNSSSLAYLFAMSATTSGYTCGTEYTAGTWTNTALHSVTDTFPDGIDAIPPYDLPVYGDPTTEHPDGTWTVVYKWGTASADSNGASSFSGTHTGASNNAGWDTAELTVAVDASTYAPISIVLKTHEHSSAVAYVETQFNLHP